MKLRMQIPVARNVVAFACIIGLLSLWGCGQSNPQPEPGKPLDTPQQVYHWKLITTWPKNLPALGTAPERLAENLNIMSSGRLDIKVYGAGELVPAFGVFDAVSQGSAQMGHGAAYYWRGKLPIQSDPVRWAHLSCRPHNHPTPNDHAGAPVYRL